MTQNQSVLSCGSVTVRSTKVLDRIKSSTSFLQGAKTRYYFTGIDGDNTFNILGQAAEPVNTSNEADSYVFDAAPFFFDQTPYMFSLHFSDAVDARIFSPLAQWCDSADWDIETHRLSIPINFANDLGDFELCWEWLSEDDVWHNGSIRSQVYSFKLDIQTHFQWMIRDVSERFNWLRLDLLRQTTWGWSRDEYSEANLNTWLTIFQDVRAGMSRGFNQLIEQHRRRLMPDVRMLRVEQMRKISPRTEEKIAEVIGDNPDKRFPVKRKALNSNTPENQYMKYILEQTLLTLNDLIERLKTVERISTIFKDRLKEWSDEWSQLRQHRFWNEIGEFHGLRRESLILTQDPLYAGIRRAWIWLQQGLEFLDQDLKGGIQNAAQLYEVWCLVKIDRLLQNDGWICLKDEGINFEHADDDWDNEELRSGSVKLVYTKKDFDKVSLDLLFQPTAGNKPADDHVWDGMMSIPVVQRPDIVLRLHRDDLPESPVYTWIFDAKYRLNGNNAPDDAVNQMHRYRDAILWSDSSPLPKKRLFTRESIGAFVLYPGDESLSDKFPQIESIEKTNVGAFPLTPSKKNTDSEPAFLKDKLDELLDVPNDFNGVMEQEARYYHSVPIVKEPSLGVISVVAIRSYMKNEKYWKTCRLYRLPVDKANHSSVPLEQWQYIAPQKSPKGHYGLFPIIRYETLNRKKITQIFEEQNITIKAKSADAEKNYYLFYLGDPISAPDELKQLPRGKVVTTIEK